MKATLAAVLTSVILGAAMIPGPAVASDVRSWEFEVLLDDKKIGYHRFDLERSDERDVLSTEASFDVRFLFITAFRYRHANTEVWSGGCLTSIDATTDNNGEELVVTGSGGDTDFTVQTGSASAQLSGCIRTFAYWNPEILQADRLLNSQTGDYEAVTVSFDGEQDFTLDGTTVKARRYVLATAGGDIKLWYSSDDRWLGLEAPARGDRKLRYIPVSVPPRADVPASLVASQT